MPYNITRVPFRMSQAVQICVAWLYISYFYYFLLLFGGWFGVGFEALGTDVPHPHCNFLVAILGHVYIQASYSMSHYYGKGQFFSIQRNIIVTVTDYIDDYNLFFSPYSYIYIIENGQWPLGTQI